MVNHSEFSKGEWDSAPVYWGPGLREFHKHRRTAIFDFGVLEMIANSQIESGAFRSRNGMDALKAPVKIGETPATFVKVTSLNEDDFSVYTPKQPEILVIINGILTVKNQRFATLTAPNSNATGALVSGDVMTLEPEGVQMRAHGLELQADSLALAIMHITPDQRGLIELQNGLNRI